MHTAGLVRDLLTDTANRAGLPVTVAVGCVGGRYRSVAIAEAIAAELRADGSVCALPNVPPDATVRPAPADGAVPENAYQMRHDRTWARVGGQWLAVEQGAKGRYAAVDTTARIVTAIEPG